VPLALTIAGSDSGGGAGIQADLRTFAALAVHGTSALTALTAQSTTEVRAVHVVPARFVRAQVETVLDDLPVRYAKTGMLATAEIVAEVAALIAERALVVVVDPVMVAESGARLLAPEAEQAMRALLLPRARLVTPNLPETEALLGVCPEAVEDMIAAARALVACGAGAALIKGGHRRGDPIDVLVDGHGEPVVLEGPRLASHATHGTGCTYSAAITALLARGLPLEQAVREARLYLREAIAVAATLPRIGRGAGPVHHMHPHYRAW
jgi:hydroxymethylpyrimidine/phosphomethylpyrimidine kinase